jgi:transposase, IS5 family
VSAKARELIGIADEVVEGARGALRQIRKVSGKDVISDLLIEELRQDIEHYCVLGERVIDQARRGVLDGEQVPNAEKIYSIFEPHTDLIKRGKVRPPVDLATRYSLLEARRV